MDLLTLDTNIIRDWAWSEGATTETRYANDPDKRLSLSVQFNRLKTLRDAGRCKLAVTNQVFTDYESGGGALPRDINDIIDSRLPYALPSISTFPMIFPAVFVDEAEIDAIFATVFPHSTPEHKRYASNRKDALQVYAHKVANRDFFVTSDKHILRARAALQRSWGIRVITLDEYLASAESKPA